jgi:hypothetical protein
MYHVTHTNLVPKIKQEGLRPMQTSNWVKQGARTRYGKGEVYVGTSLKDAVRWGAKMDWAHNQETGSGKISILPVKRDDRDWQVDKADPLTQASLAGTWLKRMGGVKPEHIGEPMVLDHDMVRKLMTMQAGGPGSGCHGENCGRPSKVQGVIDALHERHPAESGDPQKRALIVGGKQAGSFQVAERAGRLRIKTIQADTQGSGIGRLILTRILRAADKAGVTTELTASSFGHGMDSDALKAWYGRYGFEPEKGADPSLGYMVREPREISAGGPGSGRHPGLVTGRGWVKTNGEFIPLVGSQEHQSVLYSGGLGSKTIQGALAKGHVRVAGEHDEHGLEGRMEHVDKMQSALDNMAFPDEHPVTVEFGTGKPEYSGTLKGARQWTAKLARGVTAGGPGSGRHPGGGKVRALEPASGIRSYVKQIAGMGSLQHKLLDEHGTEFTHAKAGGCPAGAPKLCYMNAYRLAQANPNKYTYVEGMGMPEGVPFPLSHAWVVDKDNHVIDPTWKNASSYFGVKFKPQYVNKVAAKTGVYGVLSYTNPGLLKGEDKPAEFKAYGADSTAMMWPNGYFEMSPIPSLHPPSLDNPIDVPVDKSTDGWGPKAKKAARAKAMQDLKEVVDQMLRQTGKPTLGEQAAYPLWPHIGQSIS